MNSSDSQHRLPDLLHKRKRRPLWLRILYLIIAGILFALGVVSVVIPFVLGLPFHLAGLVFLGMASDRCREWINAAERKLSHRRRLKLREWLRKAPIRRIREMGQTEDDERDSPAREVAGSTRGP